MLAASSPATRYDVPELGRDGQQARDLGVEVGFAIFNVGDAGNERARVETRRVDGERLLERGLGFVALPGVERLARQEHVGIDAARIGLQGGLRMRHSFRRIVVRQRLRRSEERRDVPRIHEQRQLERLQRVAVLIFFKARAHPTPC